MNPTQQAADALAQAVRNYTQKTLTQVQSVIAFGELYTALAAYEATVAADAAQPEKPGAGWMDDALLEMAKWACDNQTLFSTAQQVKGVAEVFAEIIAEHAPAPQPASINEMAELEGKLLLAAQQIELAEACVKGLEQWKAEALQVLNRCNTQKLGKLLGMPLGVDIPSNLETYVAKLLGERDAWKASANFHRERGITLLDAKWLDPRCHKGCQSLVLESRVTSARQAADLLHDAVQAYLDPHQDIQPADAKREMRIALAAYESEREMSS